MSQTEVLFYTVSNAKEKLSYVCQLVEKRFIQKQRTLISVANSGAADYVDQLLWNYSRTSFIPHTVSEKKIPAAVAISTALINVNDSPVLLNLRGEILDFSKEFQMIYELFDISSEEKKKLSQRRMDSYRENGFIVL